MVVFAVSVNTVFTRPDAQAVRDAYSDAVLVPSILKDVMVNRRVVEIKFAARSFPWYFQVCA